MLHAHAGTILHHLRNRVHGEFAADQSDAQLLERFARQRDEAAFLVLMVRHGPLVLTLCRRMLHNTHDAEDAFQATFLVLARSAASIRKGESLGSWLYGVAYRIARKAAKAARRQRDLQAQLQESARPGREVDVALRELPAILDEEVNRLPAKYRSAFVLCCLQGKSRQEAARELGWKLGTLASRLAHARLLLQARLTRRGLTLPAALTALAITADAGLAVPALLAVPTADAALSFASNAGAAVSTRAAAVARSVLRGTLLAEFTRWALLFAALVLLPAAAGVAANRALLPDDPQPAPPAVPVAVLQAEVPEARKDRYGDPLTDGVVRRFGTLRLRNCDAMAFAPDGKHIVTASRSAGAQIIFWDRHTGKEMRRLPLETPVLRLQFSPDGQTLAVICNTVVANPALDVSSGTVRFRFKGEYGTFTADGRRLLGVYNGNDGPRIGAWDVATGEALGEWAMPSKARSVCCSPDGKMVAYGLDEALVLHDLTTNSELRRLVDTRPRTGPMSPPEFSFSPDGKRVAMSSLRGLRLWDAATGKEEFAWESLVDSPVCFSRDGKHMAWTGYDRRSITYAWVHAIGTNEPRRLGLPVSNLFSHLSFAPDGATLAVMTDARGLELRDVATGKDALPLDAHTGRVFGLELTPDGKSLATFGTFRVLVWDPATGALRRRFPEEGAETAPDFRPAVWDVRLTADGQLTRSNAANTHGHWEELGPTALARLQKLGLKDDGRPAFAGFDGTVQDVLESADKRYLAVRLSAQRPGVFDRMARAVMRIWDTRTGLPLDHVHLAAGADKDVSQDQRLGAFSPDGRLLVTTTTVGTIHLWDLATGRERLRLPGHPRCSVRALLFSPDQRFLFSGGDDSQVLQWDLTGRAIDGIWRTVQHEARQQMELWKRLGSTDDAAAHKALWELAADPQGTVALVQTKVKPVARVDTEATARLIDQLDSPDLAARDKAAASLMDIGQSAVPMMRRALDKPRSLEQRRRLERLVASLAVPTLTGEPLRQFRAIEILERIATTDARGVLSDLGEGLPDTWLTREASEALERLRRR